MTIKKQNNNIVSVETNKSVVKVLKNDKTLTVNIDNDSFIISKPGEYEVSDIFFSAQNMPENHIYKAEINFLNISSESTNVAVYMNPELEDKESLKDISEAHILIVNDEVSEETFRKLNTFFESRVVIFLSSMSLEELNKKYSISNVLEEKSVKFKAGELAAKSEGAPQVFYKI